LINNTLSSYTASTPSIDTELDLADTGQKGIGQLESALSFSPSLPLSISARQSWLVFAAAVFLVSVPVFVEAPIVRSLPSLSLALTAFWVWLSFTLMSRPCNLCLGRFALRL
jgi:hypothetical protein